MRSEAGRRPDPTRGRRRKLACRALLLAVCALLADAAAAQVQVTSLAGVARQAETPLSLHASVLEGHPVDVEAGARCSLLLAGHTLVRICGRAEASITTAGSTRPGAIELLAGTLHVVALHGSQEGAFRVHTPAASVLLLGSGAHVRVAPDGSETVVSALERPLQVSGRAGSAPTVELAPGQELSVRQGEAPGPVRAVSRQRLARSSPCLHAGHDFDTTLRAEQQLLASGLPLVGADAVDATPTPPVDVLLDIVRADFPREGLPLQPPSPPSALVTELSKRGVDEEVCDPITCNPVYQLDPPGACGVPPQRGCIP